MVPPAKRFAPAVRRDVADRDEEPEALARLSPRPAGVSRWVDQRGTIGLAGFRYRVGATFAGEPVEVVCHGGLVEILHAGVLVATHAQRRPPDEAKAGSPAATAGPSPAGDLGAGRDPPG